MFEQILQQFLGSSQGQAALQTLQQQHGMNPTAAQQTLGVASEGAAQALQQTQGQQPGGVAGLFSGGLTANAITGALSGMLGGGGLNGALEGGLSGVVAGKVGEMLASRIGMNPQMASLVAAGIAPHLVNFIQARMGQQNAGAQAPTAPGVFPGMVPGAMNPAMAPGGGAAMSMQPMGGPQWAPQQGKDPYAQSGKFDPSQQKFSKDDGSGQKFVKGEEGGYGKGAFDPSLEGNKEQAPGWKKGQ